MPVYMCFCTYIYTDVFYIDIFCIKRCLLSNRMQVYSAQFCTILASTFHAWNFCKCHWSMSELKHCSGSWCFHVFWN